jgi:uncharacterized protein
MLGTIVNAAAIIAGSLAGILLKGGIPERINDTVMKGLSLCVFFIGITGVTGNSTNLSSNDVLLIIFSMVIGGVLGEIIDVDGRLKGFGDKMEEKLKGRGGKVSEGFVTASLLYCVGAMAIVGSLESGLAGNHKTLFAKSVIDGVTAIVFSSTLGIGVMLSAVSVFIYQGAITLAASLLKGLLVASVIKIMTIVGSLLIIGISINMMGIGKVKVANLLPAVVVPIVYQIILGFIQ